MNGDEMDDDEWILSKTLLGGWCGGVVCFWLETNVPQNVKLGHYSPASVTSASREEEPEEVTKAAGTVTLNFTWRAVRCV